MRILVAIEDSKYSEAAVEALLAHYQPQTTEVRVIHVQVPLAFSTPPQMAKGYAPELEGQAKEARELVERAAEKLRRTGFRAEAHVLVGDVRETIIDTASEWKADVIILGCRGRKGMQRIVLGSVAESVVRYAPCSVLVVRPPAAT